MKRMTFPSDSSTSFRTALRRSSNSPRNFAPATIAPRSSETTRLSFSVSGTSPGDDAAGEPLHDGRLADAGVADQDRVVLRPPRQDLHDAADLLVAADDGVELARCASSVRSFAYRFSAWYFSSASGSVTRPSRGRP